MRYEDFDKELLDVFVKVLEDRFSEYSQFKFKLLYDLKKRTSKGKLVLASVEVPSAKLRHISKDDHALEGYDVIVIVDKNAWSLADEDDRVRIISHELRHLFVNENGNITIIDHDISDFIAEVELNKDKPDWASNLCTLVNDVYKQESVLSRKKQDDD